MKIVTSRHQQVQPSFEDLIAVTRRSQIKKHELFSCPPKNETLHSMPNSEISELGNNLEKCQKTEILEFIITTRMNILSSQNVTDGLQNTKFLTYLLFLKQFRHISCKKCKICRCTHVALSATVQNCRICRCTNVALSANVQWILLMRR